MQLSSPRQAELLLKLYSLKSERVGVIVVCQYINRQGKELLSAKARFKYKGKLAINKQQKMTIPIGKGGPGRASLWEPQRQNQTKQTLSGVAWCDA